MEPCPHTSHHIYYAKGQAYGDAGSIPARLHPFFNADPRAQELQGRLCGEICDTLCTDTAAQAATRTAYKRAWRRVTHT